MERVARTERSKPREREGGGRGGEGRSGCLSLDLSGCPSERVRNGEVRKKETRKNSAREVERNGTSVRSEEGSPSWQRTRLGSKAPRGEQPSWDEQEEDESLDRVRKKPRCSSFSRTFCSFGEANAM